MGTKPAPPLPGKEWRGDPSSNVAGPNRLSEPPLPVMGACHKPVIPVTQSRLNLLCKPLKPVVNRCPLQSQTHRAYTLVVTLPNKPVLVPSPLFLPPAVFRSRLYQQMNIPLIVTVGQNSPILAPSMVVMMVYRGPGNFRHQGT